MANGDPRPVRSVGGYAVRAAFGRRHGASAPVRRPLAERVRIIEGDFLKDPIPDGRDVILIANVLHLFPPAMNLDLLGRVRPRVGQGARLLLADLWRDPTLTEPLLAALMAGGFLLTPFGGDVYSEDEVRGWLLRSGWQPLERRHLAGPHGVIVAEAA